jgi:hypothetical protein
VHFCSKWKHHDDPILLLDSTPIKVVKEIKFLGVIFDSKLSFVPHIAILKEKCSKALDIIKVLGNTKWGADGEQIKIPFYIYMAVWSGKNILYKSPRCNTPPMTSTSTLHRGISNISCT